MQSRSVAPLVAALMVFSIAGGASAHNSWQIADNVIAFHGTTPYSNGNGYWTSGALAALCGWGARCSSAAAPVWDGQNKRWDDHDYNSPGCVLARELNAIPGVNIAVVGHSQGGIVIAHMVHDAVNGFAGGWSCGIGIGTAASWIGNLHSISAPFNGNQLADRFANPFSCVQWLATAWVLSHAFLHIDPSAIEPRSVTSMTSSNMDKFPSWVSNLGSYTIYTSYGSYDGSPNFSLSFWDGFWCMGGSGDVGIHDGVVDKYSAYAGRFSKNSSQWLMGVGVGVNHFDEAADVRANGGMGYATMTSQVWSHDFY